MTTTQDSIHEAFLWIRQLYDESRALLEDAQRIAFELGFRKAQAVPTSYGQALYKGSFPFVYLAASFFTEGDEQAGSQLFVAIDFHSERIGPHIFVGSVRHTSKKSIVPNVVNETARLLGTLGNFQTKKPAPGHHVFVHTPVPSSIFPGVEEVRHIELPLTLIDTPEKLRRLIDGGVTFVRGNERPLEDLVSEMRGPA